MKKIFTFIALMLTVFSTTAMAATFEVSLDKENLIYTITPFPADAQYVTVAYNTSKKDFVYSVTGATNDAELLAALYSWEMLDSYTGLLPFDLESELQMMGGNLEDGEVVILVQEVKEGKLVGEPTVLKEEIKAPEYEDLIGKATVVADTEGITITWDNVSDAVKALDTPQLCPSGIQFYVNDMDYYYMGSPEIDLVDGKFTISFTYNECYSDYNEKYTPKEGDELIVSVLDPDVYYKDAEGFWDSMKQNDQDYFVNIVTTTGINSVNASSVNHSMYNLQGQRISNAKGIVIMNGKKVIK